MSTLRALPKLYQTLRDEHLTQRQLREVQRTRLQKLLRHVVAKSRFYSSLYAEQGITQDNVGKVRLADLPTVNKEVLMKNFDDVVCNRELRKDRLEAFVGNRENVVRKFLGKYTVLHTSGSSGIIGLFVYGPSDWAQVKAITFLRIGRLGINFSKSERYAFIGAIDGNFSAATLSRDVPRLIARTVLLSINEPLDIICCKVDEFQPTMLAGYASGIYLLAQQQLNASINIHPRRIMCTGDPLTPVMRNTIRQAFGSDPKDFYGASEAMAFGIECDEYGRHHLFEDWVICEVLDDKLRPVRPGDLGRLHITNLYNYTQPLIRYAMNDEIIISEKPCQCGRPFRVVEQIAGRKEEFLWFARPDGSQEFIHPIVLAEFIVPGLEKCQFIQPEANTVSVKAVVKGDPSRVAAAIHDRMETILSQKELSKHVRVQVQITDAIENDPRTGKYKLILPYSAKW